MTEPTNNHEPNRPAMLPTERLEAVLYQFANLYDRWSSDRQRWSEDRQVFAQKAQQLFDLTQDLKKVLVELKGTDKLIKKSLSEELEKMLEITHKEVFKITLPPVQRSLESMQANVEIATGRLERAIRNQAESISLLQEKADEVKTSSLVRSRWKWFLSTLGISLGSSILLGFIVFKVGISDRLYVLGSEQERHIKNGELFSQYADKLSHDEFQKRVYFLKHGKKMEESQHEAK